jgi:outer membrane protein assembly factor BamB
MRKARIRSAVGLLTVAAMLAACSDGGLFAGPTKRPLSGERIAVMALERGVEPDPRLVELEVRLPSPVDNEAWPQPGGTPSHAPVHLAADGFTIAWRTSVGSGSGRSGRVTSAPIVANGRVYAMDAGTRLTAVDAKTGDHVWTFDVEPEKENAGGASGGAAYDKGRLYVATGYAQVIAIDAESGAELWRTTLTAPLRAAPTVGGGRVFAVSVDNQVHALDAETGRRLWAHSGISETAGIYGGASPALEGNAAIAAFSSGELFALRADNGRVLWADSLAGALRPDPISSLADIRGMPVIDRGQVFAASNAGRLVSIDLRSGGRIWDANIGSIYTPWVAGDFMFLTTVEDELVCMTRRDGRVRWVLPLPRFRDEKAKRGRIIWTGPILAGAKLFVASSSGTAMVVSPLTGEVEQQVRLPGPVFVPPVVANRTVYVLTDDADLVALR